MFDGLMEFIRDRFVVPMPLGKTGYEGPAREGHSGDLGSLYKSRNGNTYFVPLARPRGNVQAFITETERVIDNPTGKYADMERVPVTSAEWEGGLEAELKAFVTEGHPKAAAAGRLTFG